MTRGIITSGPAFAGSKPGRARVPARRGDVTDLNVYLYLLL